MRTDQVRTIRLRDYRPPDYLVDDIHLTFRLDPSETRVRSRVSFRPNPAVSDPGPLVLDGEGLTLVSASIDGQPVPKAALAITEEGLTVAANALGDGPFVWEAETEISPQSNTALEGLYMSKGMYVTQCEAEGFRRITYYPDRPDVMATFSVRIEGDLPVLLSNGNPVASGDGWAEWVDPHPKPSYLFALVAGDLVAHEDRFTTRSGREVALRIYVRAGDEHRCAYAMDALKRSMAWDEREYGREYDLDLFMIVAVDDFNAGAMENKGLNIFNAKYVLASPETATDGDYALIEGIIAHEYFHNWTGNRITCRDWFQLCLKEGLTVFRDQQFSGDQRGHAVKRIDDVEALKSRQFREDAGPLAHPVRPESYIEINNFYTATVYEKGAEVIRMLRTLVGEEPYRKALDLYFERHDGQACTIEDWLKVFEDATGRDLAQFKRWYTQAGTPDVEVTEAWRDGRFEMTFRQSTPPTPGQKTKAPQMIPVAYGFLARDGRPLGTPGVLILREEVEVFAFDLPERPVASLFRGFSAPVNVSQALSRDDRALILARDTDAYNRWEAGRRLATETLMAMAAEGAPPAADYLDAVTSVAMDGDAEPAFRALVLDLPSDEDVADALARAGMAPDPDAIHAARKALAGATARAMGDALPLLYEDMAVPGPYSPDAAAAGRRALRNKALALITEIEPDAATARRAFATANNMTESFAALGALVRAGAATDALAAFHDRWKDDPSVLDKWFSVQAGRTAPADSLAVVEALTRHPAFAWKTPNRFRAVLGAFSMVNHAGFHRADGAGYRLLTDWLIRLDKVNPQTTARLTTAFESWRRYDPLRQGLMKAEMNRLRAQDDLSRDSAEMLDRMLAAS